ncbi:MAG: hypothetical protein ACREMA_10920 [Longimicrobiales bacterium]
MTFLYWLALTLGGGAFLLSLVGEVFGAHGHFHLGDAHHGGDVDWGKLFSIRSLTYFLFAFGAAGVLLGWSLNEPHPLLVGLLAALTGATAWVGSTALFGYLRTSESGDRPTDRMLIGKVGQITLPLLPGSTGKVLITRSGQTQELLARPLNDDDAHPDQWSSVVIVEVRDGIAFVTPYTEEPQS